MGTSAPKPQRRRVPPAHTEKLMCRAQPQPRVQGQQRPRVEAVVHHRARRPREGSLSGEGLRRARGQPHPQGERGAPPRVLGSPPQPGHHHLAAQAHVSQGEGAHRALGAQGLQVVRALCQHQRRGEAYLHSLHHPHRGQQVQLQPRSHHAQRLHVAAARHQHQRLQREVEEGPGRHRVGRQRTGLAHRHHILGRAQRPEGLHVEAPLLRRGGGRGQCHHQHGGEVGGSPHGERPRRRERRLHPSPRLPRNSSGPAPSSRFPPCGLQPTSVVDVYH